MFSGNSDLLSIIVLVDRNRIRTFLYILNTSNVLAHMINCHLIKYEWLKNELNIFITCKYFGMIFPQM